MQQKPRYTDLLVEKKSFQTPSVQHLTGKKPRWAKGWISKVVQHTTGKVALKQDAERCQLATGCRQMPAGKACLADFEAQLPQLCDAEVLHVHGILHGIK